MLLTQAFGITNKDVVSLVGGGGKTTAMFRLADELVGQGKRVVTTTTTRIFAAQIKLAPFHLYAQSHAQALRDVRDALREHPHVLVIGATSQEGKAFGVEPALVDEISAMNEVDVVINEADGSRMRPFKAPGEHEPVIPHSTTLLVPVVGIDAVGAPLDDEHIHRAARVAALAQIPLGSVLEPVHIAQVIAHAEGGLKDRPPQARVIPLLNKVQSAAQFIVARELARQLLASAAIDAVAIGAAQNAAMPVAELQQRVAAVILAAGGATRMQGQLKQLLPWGASTLIRHTVKVVQRAQVNEIVVVVGRQADEVKYELRAVSGIRIVENTNWAQGRSTSVRVGLEALDEKFAAAIFVNADQPFLTPRVLDALAQRYAQTLTRIVVPKYEGHHGSPVLFARELFSQMEALQGDVGGRKIFDAHPEWVEEVNIADTRAAIDVDTPEQYRAALAAAARERTDTILTKTHT